MTLADERIAQAMVRGGRTLDADPYPWPFDGDWGRAKISRDEYTKAYQTTDEQYAKMLEALVAELKKTS